jgi:hypothetical protein
MEPSAPWCCGEYTTTSQIPDAGRTGHRSVPVTAGGGGEAFSDGNLFSKTTMS